MNSPCLCIPPTCLQYVEPSAISPEMGTARGVVWEELEDVGFEFLFRTDIVGEIGSAEAVGELSGEIQERLNIVNARLAGIKRPQSGGKKEKEEKEDVSEAHPWKRGPLTWARISMPSFDGEEGASENADEELRSPSLVGQGEEGEIAIGIPASKQNSKEQEEVDVLLFSPGWELLSAPPPPESPERLSSGESQEMEKKEDRKAGVGIKAVGERVAEAIQDLANAGLQVKVRRWRPSIALLAPTDTSREGTLPLQSAMQRSILVIRISKRDAIAEISNQTLLTEALTFSAQILLSLYFALLLNLGTILVGETDDRHINRRPAEVNTAPEGFGLSGYGDLEAFAAAAFMKSLLVSLSVSILFAVSVRPVLLSIWSPKSTYGRVTLDRLIWKGKKESDKQSQKKLVISKMQEENIPEAVKDKVAVVNLDDEETETGPTQYHRERRMSVLAKPPEMSLKGIKYYNFGEGLSPSSIRAQVPRWLSAYVYIQCHRREVFAQRCLFGLVFFLLFFPIFLFILIGFDKKNFTLRHK
uniref:Uncharacterized protein n=1 Tax=Chromera velia CCMP2878 TaxID=1169474 RepID=A0A0G4FU90_9ALVE|eukprot:Cvel_18618.t1-p1 / transcript=Cvel_18618.t1 / gene=Cvel_18618 / organism=Chromera_velia_CCMP2878 / gene_product=hypothetical protein / transcript_product=hypothetical protein / location=Cvel_scaffold1554:15754-20869(+) / protein_length=528 / sequence_SO=supercontig / SO=protein_coding / is_pseudo=false